MAAMLFVVLYLVPMVWIPIRFGVRSGRQMDVLRGTWKIPVVHAALLTGIYSVCFVTISQLYSAMFGSRRATWTPGTLPHTFSHGIVFGLYAALFVAVPVGVLVVIARRVTIWRMGDRVKSGHCYGCGYDLTGNLSGQCPECGAAVAGRGPQVEYE